MRKVQRVRSRSVLRLASWFLSIGAPIVGPALSFVVVEPENDFFGLLLWALLGTALFVLGHLVRLVARVEQQVAVLARHVERLEVGGIEP